VDNGVLCCQIVLLPKMVFLCAYAGECVYCVICQCWEGCVDAPGNSY